MDISAPEVKRPPFAKRHPTPDITLADFKEKIFNRHGEYRCVCVCVCVRGREGGREGERETETEKDRERERKRETETETETDRERDRDRHRERETLCVCLCDIHVSKTFLDTSKYRETLQAHTIE